MDDGWIAALVQILQPYALSDQLALRFVETYKTFNNTSSDNEVDCAFKCLPLADSSATRSLCGQDRHAPVRLLPGNN